MKFHHNFYFIGPAVKLVLIWYNTLAVAKINVRGTITLLNDKGTINFDLEVVLMTAEHIYEDTQKYYKLIQEVLAKESQLFMKRANADKNKPVEVGRKEFEDLFLEISFLGSVETKERKICLGQWPVVATASSD